MEAAFERLNQLLDIVVAGPRRKTESAWRYDELLLRRHQTQAKIVIHAIFERYSRATNLTVQQVGDVIIERQSSPHIVMLAS